ncbi:MAG TPA: TerC family protein [Caulifigura sp.]|jgi:tellurite resistance protein TerC|nr:TerC family protein [Caulifigura sp.]
MTTFVIWALFLTFIAAMVALDLGVFHRKSHTISVKEAMKWTLIWVTIALLFDGVVYYLYHSGLLHGTEKKGSAVVPLTAMNAALQYLAGYVLEYSLSVDNIFVIALIIAAFRVPPAEQHRVLFWGVLGAVVFRGLMIAGGTTLIRHFDWMMYVFGALLLYSAWKMFKAGEEEIEVEKSLVVRLARKVYPVTTQYHGSKFFVDINGKRHVTPLLLTILLVEGTDVMFALDSIPAVIGLTQESFIVFTSNIFAILGLRSLYFALAGLMDKFRYLKTALVVLLAFIGGKMILQASGRGHIPIGMSLGIIAAILTAGVVASLIASAREEAKSEEQPQHPVIPGGGASVDIRDTDA